MTHDGASSAVQDVSSCLERESDLSDAITSVGSLNGADSAAASETATSTAPSDSWWGDVIHWVEDLLDDSQTNRSSTLFVFIRPEKANYCPVEGRAQIRPKICFFRSYKAPPALL